MAAPAAAAEGGAATDAGEFGETVAEQVRLGSLLACGCSLLPPLPPLHGALVQPMLSNI